MKALFDNQPMIYVQENSHILYEDVFPIITTTPGTSENTISANSLLIRHTQQNTNNILIHTKLKRASAQVVAYQKQYIIASCGNILLCGI